MIVKVLYVTDKIGSFVPRSVLEPKKDNERVWFEVNKGRKYPTYIKDIITDSDKLCIDGQYLELSLGDDIRIVVGNILSIDEYDFYVSEINNAG